MVRLSRQLFAVLACWGGLWLCPGTAGAQEGIAVIVSSQAPGRALDSATLRGIYLKKIFLDENGHGLIPVNLPAEHPLRGAFSDAVIHMSDTQLRTYWNRRYFQGINPPYVLGSQTAVVRFVAGTPGAIGYVMPCFLDESVRQVLLLPIAPDARLEAESCPPEAKS